MYHMREMVRGSQILVEGKQLIKPDINGYPLNNIVITKFKWMLVLRNIVATILEFFHSSKNNKKLFTIVEGKQRTKTKFMCSA